MSKTNPSFMNGVPELLVLQLLSDTPMYGHEIVKAIREGTGESIALSEGAVYPVLHALEARRELSARKEVVAGRPRIYYRVTAKGKRRLRAGLCGDALARETARRGTHRRLVPGAGVRRRRRDRTCGGAPLVAVPRRLAAAGPAVGAPVSRRSQRDFTTS